MRVTIFGNGAQHTPTWLSLIIGAAQMFSAIYLGVSYAI